MRVKRESPRAAKYYRLSTGGVYSLIFKRKQSFLRVIKSLFQNYSHNIIFTSFIYPHFARDSVVICSLSSTTLQIICSYLYDCCELTERELDSIKQKPRPSLTCQEAAFVWDKIPGEETKTGILIDFLKRTFVVDWIELENIKKTIGHIPARI